MTTDVAHSSAQQRSAYTPRMFIVLVRGEQPAIDRCSTPWAQALSPESRRGFKVPMLLVKACTTIAATFSSMQRLRVQIRRCDND